MIEYHRIEQGSPEWLARRVGMYTGSNAHKLLGSFGATVYAQAIEDSFTGNFHTKRGHVLEPEACELYEAITGLKVDRSVGFITNTKYPTCLYSPDGLAPLPLLEVKCFAIKEHLKLIRAKSELDIDIKIRAQIHFGLLISERPFALLLPYNPSKELDVKDQFKIIKIRANKAIQANFKRILAPQKGVAV